MRKILIFFISSIFTFLLLQYAGALYIQYKSQRGDWIESIPSRTSLLKASSPPDYLLLGTSTIQNNINTNLMHSLGIEAFNYGLAGRYWEFYPELMGNIVKESNQFVLLSLSAVNLINSPACPDFSWHNLSYLIGLGQFNCLLGWDFPNFFSFSQQSSFVAAGKRSDEIFSGIEEKFNLSLFNDPRGLNYVRGHADRWVILFRNGDGQVISTKKFSSEQAFKINNFPVSQMNPKSISYLRYLMNRIIEQGRRPIVLIEPRIVSESIIFDEQAFIDTVGIEGDFIFNNNFRIDPGFWSDDSHFNPQGTELYTRLLTCQLKQLHSGDLDQCHEFRDKLTGNN